MNQSHLVFKFQSVEAEYVKRNAIVFSSALALNTTKTRSEQLVPMLWRRDCLYISGSQESMDEVSEVSAVQDW